LVLAGTAGAGEWSVDTFTDQDSIAAPLMRDGEPAGVLIVSERRGNMELFRTSDIDLIDLLSQQIGLALEKGFLERSLHQLIELEAQLRDQLVRLSVLKATQRSTNTAQFGEVRRDIARIKTIARERELGVDGKQA
jgi:large subunit ribosomal protein L29